MKPYRHTINQIVNQKNYLLHNKFKRFPPVGVDITHPEDREIFKKYQYPHLRVPYDVEVIDDIETYHPDKLTSEFVKSRQGQTWVFCEFQLIDHTNALKPNNVKISTRSIMLTGKPTQTFNSAGYSLKLGCRTIGGTVSISCGGVPDEFSSNLIPGISNEPVLSFTGGRNKKKIMKKMQRWLDIYYDEIVWYLNKEHEESVRWLEDTHDDFYDFVM